jgi:hypothetical protein
MSSYASLGGWLNRWADAPAIWYLKRLSANDTQATDAHQAGPYIPKELTFRIFPELQAPDRENPRCQFDLSVDSHGQSCKATAIWYNNRLRGKTRDETRITNLGGRASVLLDPESTGALTAFLFVRDEDQRRTTAHVWVARSPEEEDEIELRFGPVDPGETVTWPAIPPSRRERRNCFLSESEIPSAWLERFPSGEEILQKALELRPVRNAPVDKRLLERRNCEFQLFRSLEEIIELPRVRQGFRSIDEFLSHAQTVLQRRKARAGRSLELHLRHIFQEEGFREGMHFVHGAESDPGSRKMPDFLFPSREAYLDPSFPVRRLRMLAVKTTCKDRWRQILNEADRIAVKHLLTLQEGISESQFREMKQAGIRLVVPQPLHVKFPRSLRQNLISLDAFLEELRRLQTV